MLKYQLILQYLAKSSGSQHMVYSCSGETIAHRDPFPFLQVRLEQTCTNLSRSSYHFAHLLAIYFEDFSLPLGESGSILPEERFWNALGA